MYDFYQSFLFYMKRFDLARKLCYIKTKFIISTTNLDACVRVSVCGQNLTNFCPYGLNSTPIST